MPNEPTVPELDLDALPDDPADYTREQRGALVELLTQTIAQRMEELRAACEPLSILAADHDLMPLDRAQAAGDVLHNIERAGYALQVTWQTLAAFSGVPERRVHEIEKAAIEEEGRAMDEADDA